MTEFHGTTASKRQPTNIVELNPEQNLRSALRKLATGQTLTPADRAFIVAGEDRYAERLAFEGQRGLTASGRFLLRSLENV